MNDLSLYTSDELVEELLNRQTWVGVVICSQKEAKRVLDAHYDWVVSSQNLETPQICQLLREVETELAGEVT